jgi:hypothetical protein
LVQRRRRGGVSELSGALGVRRRLRFGGVACYNAFTQRDIIRMGKKTDSGISRACVGEFL